MIKLMFSNYVRRFTAMGMSMLRLQERLYLVWCIDLWVLTVIV